MSLNKHNPDDYLKPCPFCGSHDIDPAGVAWLDEDGDGMHYGPACDDCGATTKHSGIADVDAGFWNRREPYTSKIT